MLSSMLPDRIAGHIPSTSPISLGPSGTHHLDTFNALHVHCVSSCDKRHVTINILPDDVLLQIFHFDRENDHFSFALLSKWRLPWRWHRLVHVCRRWRSIAFASPNFLHLKLVCGPTTRVELIGIWPPLPIVIRDMVDFPMPEDYDFDAAIFPHSRVCEIRLLNVTNSQLQRLASAMQDQFPALIHLHLHPRYSFNRPAPALPDRFSAPRLQSLELHSIPFPALPNFLLSATHLVRLSLLNIPYSGYISPEAIVIGLAALTNLESLAIGFKFPLSFPDREARCPPPPTRTVLPALTSFQFLGVSEYLEDLVAQIDGPSIDSMSIAFLHPDITGIPQLAQFMRRTTTLEALNEAHVYIDYLSAEVKSFPGRRTCDVNSGLIIECRELDWGLLPLVQVFALLFPSLYAVEHLYIYEHQGPRRPHWQYEIGNLLEFFRPFATVKNLYVCREFAQRIAHELVGERATEVLPRLQNIFWRGLLPSESGPVEKGIREFISARQLSGYPVTASYW